MQKKELEQKIFHYMETHHTISLATAAGDMPHAASVFYVNIGFTLFFLSSPTSRHGENLTQNPRVSGTINEDYSNWLRIKGIQLEGRVECIGGIMKNAQIVNAYIKKFPNVAAFLICPNTLDTAIIQKISQVNFYRIIPSKICFIDNEPGFGHRDELIISE